MRYEDELSNDEYGLSYDDLKYYAVSPDTEEMFTYNRAATKEHTLSSFIEEPSVNEEEQFASDEENDYDPNADFKMPELDDADQAKLQLGLESLEGILGENCHQPTAVDALMKFNYDIEKALDDILSKGSMQAYFPYMFLFSFLITFSLICLQFYSHPLILFCVFHKYSMFNPYV